MKTKFFSVMMLLIFCLDVYAQSSKTPKWVSDKGFWIIESRIHNRKNCIVYFYNNEKQLVYKEKIEGKELKINKRKIKMKLKKVLEQTAAKFEKWHKASENEYLLENAL